MHVYRLVHHKWAAQAFDGEGAKLYGGRWNSQIAIKKHADISLWGSIPPPLGRKRCQHKHKPWQSLPGGGLSLTLVRL